MCLSVFCDKVEKLKTDVLLEEKLHINTKQLWHEETAANNTRTHTHTHTP